MKKGIDFIKGFLEKINEDDSIAYAYQLTYGLLLAIFPFLIFLMTLIAYLGLDTSYILNFMRTSFPEDIFKLMSGPVEDLVKNQRGGLLSVSVLAALYTSSGGFRAFMKGMNKSMGFKDQRNIVYKYLVSILWVVQLAATILVALIGIVFGKQILSLISFYFPHFPAEGVIDILRILLPVLLLFGILSLVYMFIPVKNIKFKHAFPGAISSTLLWITVTFAFQFYVNNYANYSRFYGTLGALIGLMLWLLFTSIIMILGSSLNSYLIQVRNVEYPFIKIKIGRKTEEAKEAKRVKEEEKNKEKEKNKEVEEAKRTDEGEANERKSLDPEHKFEVLKEGVRKTMDSSEEK